MQSVTHFVRVFAAAAIVCLPAFLSAAPDASAADKRVIVTKEADYSGFDYSTLKGVTLDACQTACLADQKCKAFTFNEKAGWCFMKSDFGALATASGATAGRVTDKPAIPPTTERRRLTELNFLSSGFIDEARKLAADLKTKFPPSAGQGYADMIGVAAREGTAGRRDTQAKLIGQALAVTPEDGPLWLSFALANAGRKPASDAERTEIRVGVTAGAINAYLRAESNPDRAGALAVLAAGLGDRSSWKQAIRAYRDSLALQNDPRVRTAYDKAIAEHGFRIASHAVDADADSPRICLVFSDALKTDAGIEKFFTAEPSSGVSVEPEEKQVCLDGVKHGGRYTIRVRAGLPSADGETLSAPAELSVFVRDRAPWVGFAGNAYVLPAGNGASIPITSINADKAEAAVYRIGDRGLAGAIRDEVFSGQLSREDAEGIAEKSGEKVWEGEVLIKPVQNEQVITGIPISDAVTTFKPGVYAITARLAGGKTDYWDPQATQWFVVSDLGMTSLSGTDGIHALIRSLATAKPVAGATVRLVAVNNEVLGEAKTDAEGHALFAAGLARGKGGMAPQLITAEATGDYAFLDLGKSAFDLTDRGVAGRTPPAALDVYLTTERGVYRPGETAYITALVRDARANAVGDLPLTLVIERPDGVESSRRTLSDKGLGSYHLGLPMAADAMRGSWRMKLYADPKGEPLAQGSILVEDFEPEKLAFEVTTEAKSFPESDPITVDLAARYLYGATAPGLAVEGEVAIRPVDGLAAYPGFSFGRADDTVETVREPLDISGETDEQGKASLEVALPELPDTTRLLKADMIFRLTDTDGRAVERQLSLPVTPDGPRIGIKPLFSGEAPEGGQAQFNVILVDPDGKRLAAQNVRWTLERLETSYQWYRTNGNWKYEANTVTRRVADGRLNLTATDPGAISARVDYGRYRLEVTTDGADPTSSSVKFDAGWYVAQSGSETPDALQVGLDKPAYRIGETAKLRLEARYAGTALVMVVDNRLIAMKAVAVPAGASSIDMPVTDAWGPGAYVSAALYRPMDIEAKRMPARALGLAWAKVSPESRALTVSLGVADEVKPRGPMVIPVAIEKLAPGTEAYVTVAAVDLGILNLTNFKPPAPEDFYFAQRRLGVEFRDLYGQLIDRMQGVPGALRSGGDGGPTKFGAPPPTQKLLAFHSGVVKVGSDGKASVSFDMPDFNGTARVMAMAWSKEGVGHAVKDVFVRDPVVVVASTPRFLNVGDQSRLMVEVNNLTGAAGSYRLAIAAPAGLTIAPADASRTLTLEAGARTRLNVPITGAAPGDFPIRITLTLPNGQELPKEMMLGVRPAEEPVQKRLLVSLNPGARLVLDEQALADFVPGTATASVSVGGASRLDVPGLLTQLDRYPYGCAEQITSRALPLVYLNTVAASIGMAEDAALKQRIQNAILGVLAKQRSAGGFGLWGPSGDDDLWLDAYVTDFLTRAKQTGYDLPETARVIALDNLANQVAYAKDFSDGGTDLAYALYVLARNGRAQMSDLRYYAEAKLSAFSTPLAKAQVGAALALYGDRLRAGTAFKAALADLKARQAAADRGYRLDYGSVLRDQAAVITLASETSQPDVDIRALARDLAATKQARKYTSTQEQAWMLLAANALIKDAERVALTVDDQPLDGLLNRKYPEAQLRAKPVTIVNRGTLTVDAAVTTLGVPRVPEPAGGEGFKIERVYHKPDGTAVNVATVQQNERFVVTLTVTSDQALAGRLMVVDRIPVGFEIENPNLSESGKTSYGWLNAESNVAHSEARTDRFVAALNRNDTAGGSFTVAYSVRAVSPGTFVQPAATVEDMYRPERRARTATGKVEVVGPTR